MNEKPGMDSVSALSDKKKMGKRIKAARNRVGLSQEALGAAVGKSSVYMSNVETGKANASLETVVSIANALRVSMDEFLYDEVERTEPALPREFMEELKDCDSYEIRAISEYLKETKKILRECREQKQNQEPVIPIEGK